MRSLSISAPSERIMGSFKSQMASTANKKNKQKLAIQLRFVSLHGLSKEGTKIGLNLPTFWCPTVDDKLQQEKGAKASYLGEKIVT